MSILGRTRYDILRQLSRPDRALDATDCFYEVGLAVDSDKDKKAAKVRAYHVVMGQEQNDSAEATEANLACFGPPRRSRLAQVIAMNDRAAQGQPNGLMM